MELGKIKEYLLFIKEYANGNLKQLSTFGLLFSTIVLWGIKGVGYCYQSGRFSFYGIDRAYIEINENYLLQVFQSISLIVLSFLINYIYLYLSRYKDDSTWQWKRRMHKLGFFVLEIVFILFILIVSGNISIMDAIKEVIEYPSITKAVLLAEVLGVCFLFNMFGWQVKHIYKKSLKSNQKD